MAGRPPSTPKTVDVTYPRGFDPTRAVKCIDRNHIWVDEKAGIAWKAPIDWQPPIVVEENAE